MWLSQPKRRRRGSLPQSRNQVPERGRPSGVAVTTRTCVKADGAYSLVGSCVWCASVTGSIIVGVVSGCGLV